MSDKVFSLTDKDCRFRERQFKDAYKLDISLSGCSYHDSLWNYDMVVLKFVDSMGKKYGIVEYYNEGNDNSTKYVELEYSNKDNTLEKVRFDRFIDAELEMVGLINKRLKGED